MNQLRTNIMRRVYYTFVINKLKHPVVSHSIVLAVSFFMFTKVVSVPSVWKNLMEIKVGETFSYLTQALIHTDVLTWSLLLLMLITLVSMLWKTARDNNHNFMGDRGGLMVR